ncbi:MAG: GNAT family N-acetyltransferase [Pleurocapsa sp. SU_196_0]|nr:GNAT family N-acetyltransferase [Pleurocapsa sp. SU_196_0]
MPVLKTFFHQDLNILLELMRDYYAHDGLEFNAAKAAQAVKDMLETSGGRVWLILEADIVIGYVVLIWSYSLEYGGLAAELDELYLRSEARGHGVGRAVMQQVLEICREAGVVLLRLETEPGNEAARGFYGSLGFEIVKREFMQLVNV